jgi:hypothetical protein
MSNQSGVVVAILVVAAVIFSGVQASMSKEKQKEISKKRKGFKGKFISMVQQSWEDYPSLKSVFFSCRKCFECQ